MAFTEAERNMIRYRTARRQRLHRQADQFERKAEEARERGNPKQAEKWEAKARDMRAQAREA